MWFHYKQNNKCVSFLFSLLKIFILLTNDSNFFVNTFDDFKQEKTGKDIFFSTGSL